MDGGGGGAGGGGVGVGVGAGVMVGGGVGPGGGVGVGVGVGGGGDVELVSKTLQFEHKLFYFDLKENPRGRYLKISEKTSATRSTIIVPVDGVAWFLDLFDYYIRTDERDAFSKELRLQTKVLAWPPASSFRDWPADSRVPLRLILAWLNCPHSLCGAGVLFRYRGEQEGPIPQGDVTFPYERVQFQILSSFFSVLVRECCRIGELHYLEAKLFS